MISNTPHGPILIFLEKTVCDVWPLLCSYHNGTRQHGLHRSRETNALLRELYMSTKRHCICTVHNGHAPSLKVPMRFQRLI